MPVFKTVEGDSLYVFRKNNHLVRQELANISPKQLEDVLFDLTDRYLRDIGSATPSKILDDFIIPQLWRRKLLHLISADTAYQKLINDNYQIDKETRRVIGRK